MNDMSAILKDIKHAVTSVDVNAEVILFGSRARGDYEEESDWDVLILTNDGHNRDLQNGIRNSLYALELKLGIVISSIVRNRQFWEDVSITPLYKEVEKDGISL